MAMVQTASIKLRFVGILVIQILSFNNEEYGNCSIGDKC